MAEMTAFMDPNTDAPTITPCQQDAETWFPVPGDKGLAAKALCQPCPIKAECLQLALKEEGTLQRTARYGIRGGLTPNERYDLVKESA